MVCFITIFGLHYRALDGETAKTILRFLLLRLIWRRCCLLSGSRGIMLLCGTIGGLSLPII